VSEPADALHARIEAALGASDAEAAGVGSGDDVDGGVGNAVELGWGGSASALEVLRGPSAD
jgi:hypothetical protein